MAKSKIPKMGGVPRDVTAQNMQMKAALGQDVLRVTQPIDRVNESGLCVPAYLRREVLSALNAHSPELPR
jgi:hypothetical protein